jgi:splicing factor U2AF subunit
MASPEDLFEDDIFEDLMRDITEECQRYGPIERIEIPRPDINTGLCSPSIGKVFVKFKYLIPAKKARHFLSGN